MSNWAPQVTASRPGVDRAWLARTLDPVSLSIATITDR